MWAELDVQNVILNCTKIEIVFTAEAGNQLLDSARTAACLCHFLMATEDERKPTK